jgi:hypothetical protein
MAHPIYVCLKCKVTMHSAKNAGCHCRKHGMGYWEAEQEGFVVCIGECTPTLWKPCPSPKNRPSTPQELEAAEAKLKEAKP